MKVGTFRLEVICNANAARDVGLVHKWIITACSNLQCVCVCVCVCARARVCACVRVLKSSTSM